MNLFIFVYKLVRIGLWNKCLPKTYKYSKILTILITAFKSLNSSTNFGGNACDNGMPFASTVDH